MFFAVNINFSSRILSEEYPVVNFHVERDHLAVFIQFSFTDSNHSSFLRFFLSRVRNNNASLALFLFLDSFHDDPILQRRNFHFSLLSELDPKYLFLKGKLLFERRPLL